MPCLLPEPCMPKARTQGCQTRVGCEISSFSATLRARRTSCITASGPMVNALWKVCSTWFSLARTPCFGPSRVELSLTTSGTCHGHDYYDHTVVWSYPLALAGQSVAEACAPGGFVNKVITAAGGK